MLFLWLVIVDMGRFHMILFNNWLYKFNFPLILITQFNRSLYIYYEIYIFFFDVGRKSSIDLLRTILVCINLKSRVVHGRTTCLALPIQLEKRAGLDKFLNIWMGNTPLLSQYRRTTTQK